MKLWYKFRNRNGFSLSLVLFILMLVSTFTLLYHSLLNHTQVQLGNEIAYYRASINAESGVQAAFRLEPLNVLHEQFSLDKSDLQAEVHRYRIGFSEHIFSQGIHARTIVNRHGIVMDAFPQLANIALISSGRSFFNPLYVTGNTSITGDVITGKYGMSKQSIRNIYYRKKELLNGRIVKSAFSEMPQLNLKAIEQIKRAAQSEISAPIRLKSGRLKDDLSELIGPATLFFSQLPKSVKRIENCNIIIDDDVDIDAIEIHNSLIYSKRFIRIKSAQEDNQFVSETGIILEETAQLTGNNLLLVIGDEFDIRAKRPKIRIASSAYVEGMIVYSAPPASSYRDQFTPFDISSQTKLKGIIYSPFAISSELNIDGLICLNYFEFNYGGTRYQNYIKDLTINALESYNGFSIFEKGERYLAQSIEVE